jgi:hypothetical protein
MKVMKRNLIILSLSLVTSAAVAQGLVNFYNNPNTLVGPWPYEGVYAGLPLAGSFYFGLLTAPPGTSDPRLFSFSNVYGTNGNIAGRFTGGSGVEVPGWAPGTTRSFMVASWSKNLGHQWDPGWLSGNFASPGLFGLSSIGTGMAGGFDGTSSIFALSVFGGSSGIQTGFYLYPVGLIPEPSIAALTFLGGAMLMFYRRGKKWNL